MKDSGVEWIGEIPKDWDQVRIKDCYDIALGKMIQTSPNAPTDTLENYLCAANVSWDGIHELPAKQMWMSIEDKPSLLLRRGDLLVTEGGSVGESAIYKDERNPCYFQNSLNRVRGKNPQDNLFLYYWLYALEGAGYIRSICSSVSLAHFTKEKLGETFLFWPPKVVRDAITDYLDAKCAAISDLTKNIRARMEKLEEYKTAVVTQTVTKGLDPNTSMKYSGVEWIGKIPKHWSIGKIKHIADPQHPYSVGDGDHGLVKSQEYSSVGIPYIRVSNLTWGHGLNIAELTYIPEELNERIKGSELRPGDLLIAKTGSVGKTAIVPASIPVSNTTSHVGKITVSGQHDPFFYYYVLNSDVVQLQIKKMSAMQSTRPELGIEGLKNLVIPMPPLHEQRAIAKHLDGITATVDKRLSDLKDCLVSLAQYKKSLIFHCVTGKKEPLASSPTENVSAG